MPIPSWLTTEVWNRLVLGGKTVPGKVTVSLQGDSGIDTRKPRGGKLAPQRDVGAPPLKLRVEVSLKPEQCDEFEREIVPILRPRGVREARDPLEITHPEARFWGVDVVMPGEIESSHPAPGGRKTVVFSLEEWAPEAKQVRKSQDKPKDADHDENWNVQPRIDELRPARANAARQNLFAPPP